MDRLVGGSDERRAATSEEEEVVGAPKTIDLDDDAARPRRASGCESELVNDEAEGVLLRALTREDAEAIVSGDRGGRRWASDYPTPGDEFIARGALEGVVAFVTPSMPWGLYAIVERRSGRSVGGIGFKSSPNGRGEVEIGYGVCDSSQGRGVATEAVLAMCDLARAGATAVLADTFSSRTWPVSGCSPRPASRSTTARPTSNVGDGS
jgi:RimJ/RimL family protein N-acetyltransferase